MVWIHICTECLKRREFKAPALIKLTIFIIWSRTFWWDSGNVLEARAGSEHLYFLVLASLLKLESLNCIPTLQHCTDSVQQQARFFHSKPSVVKNVVTLFKIFAAFVVVSRAEQNRNSFLNALSQTYLAYTINCAHEEIFVDSSSWIAKSPTGAVLISCTTWLFISRDKSLIRLWMMLFDSEIAASLFSAFFLALYQPFSECKSWLVFANSMWLFLFCYLKCHQIKCF